MASTNIRTLGWISLFGRSIGERRLAAPLDGMGEFLLELWSFMKERKKFWLLPDYLLLSPAGRPHSFHIRFCSRAFHLHALLEQ
jgi:Family of unknown function (DUF5989)